MLKINGQEISGVEKAKENDTRERAFGNHPYIKAYFDGTAKTFDFKVNGVPAQFAEIGTRPRFTLRKQITGYSRGNALRRYYYNAEPARSGAIEFYPNNDVDEYETLIPAEEKARYIVVEMIGGGGGGSGGSAFLNGVGGGAGAFALLLIDMDNFQGASSSNNQPTGALRLYSNGGGYTGQGSSNRGQAYAGGSVEVGGVVCNGGGGGAGSTGAS